MRKATEFTHINPASQLLSIQRCYTFQHQFQQWLLNVRKKAQIPQVFLTKMSDFRTGEGTFKDKDIGIDSYRINHIPLQSIHQGVPSDTKMNLGKP